MNETTDSVLATILLERMTSLWKKKGCIPFFKFKTPCNHKLYEKGNSWCEELGYTGRQFDTALNKIAHKTTRKEKNQGDKLVYYWTDKNSVTYYALNE